MKVQQFDYFTKVQAECVDQKSSPVKAEDFDLGFQPSTKGGQSIDVPASGWTCTLICHLTEMVCPTKSCS